MTSSLVGSEMCIRDRSNTSFVVILPSEHVNIPDLLPAATCQCFTLPLAVSYTHLTLPTICSV
eukprot:2967985-Prorocentrum_lima.AAC.1